MCGQATSLWLCMATIGEVLHANLLSTGQLQLHAVPVSAVLAQIIWVMHILLPA